MTRRRYVVKHVKVFNTYPVVFDRETERFAGFMTERTAQDMADLFNSPEGEDHIDGFEWDELKFGMVLS